MRFFFFFLEFRLNFFLFYLFEIIKDKNLFSYVNWLLINLGREKRGKISEQV